MKNLPVRKPNRLKNYDYSQNGTYFITICTKNHEELFGTVVGEAICLPLPQTDVPSQTHVLPQTHISGITADNNVYTQITLSDIGNKIEIAINNIPKIYPDTSVDIYVIMPNHIHIILIIDNNNGRTDNNNGRHGRQIASPTTVKTIIGQMKRFVSMQCGFSVWQKSFHDHIIRNQKEYYRIVKYIKNNPMRWINDCYYKK